VPQARIILIALIATSPLILLWDGLIVQGALAGGIAIALVITAISLRPGETQFLVSVIRLVAVVAAVPALWIIFQVLPLRALAHPIWTSAQAALGHPLWNSISIDPGETLIALGQYLTFCAVVAVSAAVGVDRARAENVLLALTAVSAAIALIPITRILFIMMDLPQFMQAQTIDCVAMGAIIATASCFCGVERFQLRHRAPERSPRKRPLVPLIAGGAALFVCLSALALEGALAGLIAAGCGIAAVLLLMVIRWFDLGRWGTAGIATAALFSAVVAILVLAAQPTEHDRTALLAFSNSPSAVTERVLKDAPALGTGAETFALITPVYREIGDPQLDMPESTAAANLAIELGRPMLWLITAAIFAAIIVLLRAALYRGRDSFYSAMGAACLIAMLLLAFVNSGMFGNAAGLICASVLGLAIAQSKSRVLQQLT